MKRNLAGLAGVLALLVVELHAVRPADACGVKLTIKTSAPRKAVARTSRPSRVLLVGSPPRRLQRDLTAAGHKVDTAPNTQSARDGQYAVVIVDSNDQASAARERFTDANVVVRSGDVGADIRSVEDRVARKPVKADSDRGVIAAREVRTPIAVGPAKDERRVVAVKEPSETPPPVETTPPPTRTAAATPAKAPAEPPKQPDKAPEPVAVTTTVPRSDETPRVKEPRAERPVKTSAELRQEIYFGLNSSSVRNTAALARAKKWLDANPGVNAVVAGHADPTGTPEGNMALSQTRAESVRDALVGMGVDSSRLEVQAHGDTKLKYGARDGRNRRVAIEATK